MIEHVDTYTYTHIYIYTHTYLIRVLSHHLSRGDLIEAPFLSDYIKLYQ